MTSPPHFGLRPDRRLEEVLGYFKTPGRVFVPGCGYGGTVLFLLEKKWEVVAFDKNAEALTSINGVVSRKEKVRLTLTQDNVLTFELTDQQFDLIIISNLLHFLDQKSAISFLRRAQTVLRPGGIIFLRLFSQKDFMTSLAKPDRYYPALKKLLALLNNLKIVDLQEKQFKDNHEPYGSHTHDVIELIIQRKVKTNAAEEKKN